ncbi:hypothetical protein BHS09_09005 [Myxococcus xanthus]|uniref:Uncharacterized protein n=1 Tax=Myxococcus xanthus TaxID=34 RepID=A0AAE6FXS9_MYXXA|nr:hypothetical protein [Myxococcus xanthus]QDE67127.1 hypothetical protein BHS09_09005 [Myxococcus xanthus]QDE74402.1 hypothetical protein BHS08_09015 [Myxococcus xanthus]
MRRGFRAESVEISHFQPGDPIFETERMARVNYKPLLKKGGSSDGDIDLGEFFKPSKDEFKAISKGLRFLKYSEADAQELYNLIGGAIKLASSIVTVIGIVGSVADIAKAFGLFGPKERSTDEWLKEIGAQIEQIYGYLARENQRGLYNEALRWRVANEGARAEQWNVRISRSQGNLEALKDRAGALDDALRMMLDPNKANIAFQKSVYGYAPESGHWIDAAGTPALTRADGGTVPPYAIGIRELTSDIWDAGHYIEVLFSALRERLIVATALEPAFRSTAYDRAALLGIADGLRTFIAKWRASILVANPAAGINGGNNLYNPCSNPDHAADGILIGAVDPVTGISSLRPFGDFKIKYSRTDLPFAAWGGQWDTAVAVEPENALAAAMSAHAPLVDSVIRTCGIEALTNLERQFRIAAAQPTESQFVRFSDAKFSYGFRRIIDIDHINMPFPIVRSGTPETLDLGRLKLFAADPHKTYPATRFHREMEKTFRFRMARRAEWSRIQLGYRLWVAGLFLELCPFSRRPPEGAPSAAFPSGLIEKDYVLETDVYDCCQIRHFSFSDEDRFEREGENGERIFHNARNGRAHFRISVQFEPLAGGADDAHAGEAIVTIRALEPDTFRDAFILEVRVFESVVDYNGEKAEYPTDSMTVHMTPSYLIVGQDFFDDVWDAQMRMVQMNNEINDKYPLEFSVPRPPEPDPNPVWKIRRRALEIENGFSFIQAAQRERPELVADELIRFRPPLIR